jgi:hypothetical protein
MPMNPVAARIQAILETRGEKMKPVADSIGAGYYSIYPWWQREHAKADYEKVKLFANYFGVPVGHLMYGDSIEDVSGDAAPLLERIHSLKDDERKELESYVNFLISKR